MPNDKFEEAFLIGEKKSAQIIAQRKEVVERKNAMLESNAAALTVETKFSIAENFISGGIHSSAGYLLAAGDSWFDYPFHDVLTFLEDEHGYEVYKSAHAGATIESMAYHGGQLVEFQRGVERIQRKGAVPKAVLLSGGGNDIAGVEFGMLLNNADSAIAGWEQKIVDGLINDRISCSYVAMISALNKLCSQAFSTTPKILVHGYGYPVPDGRGFLGGWGPLPGPWLKPGFKEKLFEDLNRPTELMIAIIDKFNDMVHEIANLPQFKNVEYVDLRDLSNNDLTAEAYKNFWANELHPTETGFRAVSNRFASKI